jgi:signal transduction histidine kinase
MERLLSEILDTAANAIRRSFALFNVALFLKDKATGEMMLHSIAGGHATVVGPGYRQETGEGVVGWVAETGRSLLANDVAQEPRYRPFPPAARPVGSELAVPMMHGDDVIGVLDIQALERGFFAQEDVRGLEALADQLAVAIENTRLYEETRRHLEELTVLHEVALASTSTLDMGEMANRVVAAVQKGLGFEYLNLLLANEEQGRLEPLGRTTQAGLSQGGLPESHAGQGVSWVAEHGVALRVADVSQEPRYFARTPGVRSALIVPMVVGDRVIGVMHAASPHLDAFSEADERLLTMAAAQAAIAIEHARLYGDLELRAENVAEAYAGLKEADRIKDEVLQNISHELRTPLTFVKGYVELLLDGSAGPLTEEQQEYLVIVAEKTEAIARLVEDIVFLDQADRLPGKKVPVSLVRVARQALRGWAATAEEAHLTLVENLPDDLPPVAGDEGRLLQVFDNLLSNATKFSPDGGQIVVTIADAGPMVQASVSDEGIGIPRDQHERIFQRFYQVDGSAQRRFRGTGLGLAIVKRIVETHEGQVWVESEPVKGSSFYFTIPKYRGPKT